MVDFADVAQKALRHCRNERTREGEVSKAVAELRSFLSAHRHTVAEKRRQATGQNTRCRIAEISGFDSLTGSQNKRDDERVVSTCYSPLSAVSSRQRMADALKHCTSVVVFKAPTMQSGHTGCSYFVPLIVRPVVRILTLSVAQLRFWKGHRIAVPGSSPLFQLAVSANRVRLRAGAQLKVPTKKSLWGDHLSCS